MDNDKSVGNFNPNQQPDIERNNDKETITLHNPFKPGTDIIVSKEDFENEQKYKEAATERD